MNVDVKRFRGAGFLKTILLLMALLGLFVLGAGTARAQEGAEVYGLYKTDDRVYACDAQGTNPGAEIDKKTVTNLFVEDGVETIGNWAFRGCPLTSVTLPNTLTEICYSAFENC